MNRRAQLDELNVAFVGLALVGGFIAWFVANRAVEGGILPIITGVLGVVLVYFYLVFTDR